MLGTTCNGLWKGNRALFKTSNKLLLSITGRNLSNYMTKHSYQLLKRITLDVACCLLRAGSDCCNLLL